MAAAAAGGIATAMNSLATEVPVFGSLFTVLQKLAAACERTSVNKRSCERVKVWTVAVVAALEGAAPALIAAGEGGRGAESIADLVEAFEGQVTALKIMAESYGNKRYIVRVLTSGQFKSQFDEAAAAANEMMTAISLVMQAIQMQLAASSDPGPGGVTAGDIERSLAPFQAKVVETQSVTLEIDAKLDGLIKLQAELLEGQKKQDKEQGVADRKLDALLDLVVQLSAEGTVATSSFAFAISSTLGQQIDMMDVMNQTVTSHGGGITPWALVADGAAGQADVVTETEWAWLGAYLSRGMDHEFGKVPAMQVCRPTCLVKPRTRARGPSHLAFGFHSIGLGAHLLRVHVRHAGPFRRSSDWGHGLRQRSLPR